MLTNEFQASTEFLRQRIDAVVLDLVDVEKILSRPLFHELFLPSHGLAYAEYLANAELLEELRIVRVTQIAQVHVRQDTAWKATIHLVQPLRRRWAERLDVSVVLW